MLNPDSCKGSFTDRVIIHISHLSDSIDERLVYGYLRLEDGLGVSCNLRGLCCDHRQSTSEGVDFFDVAYKQIAEGLAKDYSDRGWEVTITYISDGKRPILKFEHKVKDKE